MTDYYHEPAYYDPNAQALAELAELRQWAAQQEQAKEDAERERADAELVAELDAELVDAGLTQAEQEVVLGHLMMQAEWGQRPEVAAAVDAMRASHVAHEAEVRDQGPPEVRPDGTPATNRDRVEWLTERADRDDRAQRDLNRREGNDDRAWVREGRDVNLSDHSERVAWITDRLEQGRDEAA